MDINFSIDDSIAVIFVGKTTKNTTKIVSKARVGSASASG
jgi:hypothetical protein